MSEQFLRSSPWVNWTALVTACLLMIAPAPGLLESEAGLRLPPALTGAVLAGAMCELFWRCGIRPRLLWNAGGIVIVHPLHTVHLRWTDVASVRSEGNLILVTSLAGHRHEWGFDRVWWLASRSPTYANRGGRIAEHMSSLIESRRLESEVHRLPAADYRRPVAFLLLIMATAAASHFATPLVTAP